MRSAANRGVVLAAALLALPACKDEGGDDGAATDDTAGTMDDTGTETGTGDGGTADDTGSGTDDGSGDSTGEGMGPWGSFEERPCPEDSILTFENFGGPFMLSYCTGCHHSRLPADMRQMAPLDVNFDDIEDIRAWADRIWIRGGDQNFSMPPVGPPEEDERYRLGEWLACGAPTDAELGM